MGATKPVGDGALRLLYGGPLLGIAWIAEPPWYGLGRPPMNKTGSGSALPRAMLLLLLQTEEQLLGNSNTKNSIESLFPPIAS